DTVWADPGLDLALYQEQFSRLVGLPDTLPVHKGIEQIIGDLIAVIPENYEKINFVLAYVAAQNPTSLLEAQLLVQLHASHRLCLRMLQKAGQETWPESIDKYTNIAMKLSRGYKQGIEALAKYRRGGKQYLYIERVNVEKDGQAVIGNMEGGK
ncbi:MAG: hypothetical protein R6T90_03590, partial [Dissulfuribacterales bacterium]